MPVSPFRRADEEVAVGHEPPPQPRGKKKRKARQSKRKLYQRVREDLQVSGDLPVTPEGALRPEQVPPSAQGSQPMPELIAQAIRRGWATRDDIKPGLVDELVAIVMDAEMPVKQKIAAFNALRMADRSQWEQDHPEEAGKAKGGGGTVAVSVQTNIDAIALLNKMVECDRIRGDESTTASTLTGAIGNGRLNGEVEAGAAPEGGE